MPVVTRSMTRAGISERPSKPSMKKPRKARAKKSSTAALGVSSSAPRVNQFPAVRIAPLYGLTKVQRLTYTAPLTMNLVYTTGVISVFRANSIYDPDYSGVGSQPYGYDQMAALYGKYDVLSSTINVIWNPATLTNQARYHFKIFRASQDNLGVLSLTDTNDLIEAPGSNLATLGHVDENAIRQFSVAKMTYKKSDLFDKSVDTSAAVSTNPTAAASGYFIVCAFPVGGGTTSPGNTEFRVRMTFKVKYTEPIKYIGS